ncbi:hypothetical protein XENOCAPTIV_008849, partial [Xenoophorus captivus]
TTSPPSGAVITLYTTADVSGQRPAAAVTDRFKLPRNSTDFNCSYLNIRQALLSGFFLQAGANGPAVLRDE